MSLQLLELASWRGTRTSRGVSTLAYVRPAVETLEERTVMASPASVGSAVGGALAHAGQTASFLPINITNVVATVTNGVTSLTAVGNIAGQAFTAPLSLVTSPNTAPGAECPILDLHLGPINLDLLGLKVQTSEICLSLTALPGSGNLLGNLLCDVSHLLDQGTSLTDILNGLGGLTSTQTQALTTGLTNLLGGAFGALADPANAQVLPSTNILHLSVGPLNLNLLGLEVNLDNCHDGPVTVDISAQPGAGNLLGNLLSSIAHLADRNPNIAAIDHLLAQIGRRLDRLF